MRNDITKQLLECREYDYALLERAADEIARLREALEFYADRSFEGYAVHIIDYGLSTEEGEIVKDGGQRARAALEEGKK